MIQWHVFMSLDGVVDADDDWQYPYFDDELFSWVTSAWERADAVLLGRRTFEGYESVRAHHPTSPVVAFLDSLPVHVVTSRPLSHARSNLVAVTEDVLGHVGDLRDRATTVLLMGSPGLARQLVAGEQVDALDLMVLPVLAGDGVRLFAPDGGLPRGLRLNGSRALTSGAVHLDYHFGVDGGLRPG